MSPLSLSTIPTSPTLTLDGNKLSNQSHDVEKDWSPSLKEGRYEVQLEPEDDPQQLPLYRRWLAVATISSAALCVTCASSVASICNKVLESGPATQQILALSGGFYYRCRGTSVSCGKRSCNLGNQLVCHGPRHRPSLFRAVVGTVWSKHRLPCVLHLVFRLYVPRRICTGHR